MKHIAAIFTVIMAIASVAHAQSNVDAVLRDRREREATAIANRPTTAEEREHQLYMAGLIVGGVVLCVIVLSVAISQRKK